MTYQIRPRIRMKNLNAIVQRIKKTKDTNELNKVKNEIIKDLIKREKEIQRKEIYLKERFAVLKCKAKKR